jgi:hypothetical protein
MPPVLKFVSHSRTAVSVAIKHGWLAGARYTNLRDARSVGRIGFLDIDWRNYDFRRHLAAVKARRPHLTVARDILRRQQLQRVLDEAFELSLHCDHVVVVPKARSLAEGLSDLIPVIFLLGYSVPTRYGGTPISPLSFTRAVHLLGGRPDRQRVLANVMPVVSLDCNRFTLDAAYGDFFDGARFKPHPIGGYHRCLEDSLININALWADYHAPVVLGVWPMVRRAA